MTTKYGRSPWIDLFPKSRVPAYPHYRGTTATDVVVVGGGLTGCVTAYALAANGVKVVLLEGQHLGRGASGSSAGWIGDDPGVPFAAIEKLHGLRAARRVWQAWRRAALDFATLLRRLDIKCYLEPHPTAIVAMTADDVALIKRDLKSRRDAGIEAVAMNGRTIRGELGIVASTGLRLKDGVTIDPYRATLGIAAAARERRAALFERTPVQRITFDRKAVDVHTAGGTVHARRVVVATGAPTALFRSLARHFRFRTAYAALTQPVPSKIRKQLGARAAVLRDAGNPPHLVRWVTDDRLIVAGADQEVVPARQRDRVIVQRTGQLMYELSLFYPDLSGIMPAYGWDAAYARTVDGLPYIGAHRNFPHHLFAWGDAGHSLTSAYLASRIVLRQLSSELDPADNVFGFAR